MNKPSELLLNAMIDAFYAKPGNICGGILHIVLDDENYETHHVEWCREEAVSANDQDAIFIADVLLLYTEEERAVVLHVEGDPEDL